MKPNTRHRLLIYTMLMISLLPMAIGQSKKLTQAVRTTSHITIDGILDEPDWMLSPVCTGFTELRPNPGKAVDNECRVYLLYDDTGIYVGAELEEKQIENLGLELFERDAFDLNKKIDWFEVILDCYQNGLIGYGFAVSAAGVQTDLKYGGDDGPDVSWDAVWQSAVTLGTDKWFCEIKVPYSALRFPNQPEQRWGIQFDKGSYQRQEESYWSPIDAGFDDLLPQNGILEGIRDITPPIRLSATPFLAVYAENVFFPGTNRTNTWGSSYNGGMDVRYGISDAYTMDMTLIPDFGQVQSDNEVLNISPFEVQFAENRQFFTEGTELFTRADLFYSRRVGDEPYYLTEVYADLQENEFVREIKTDSRLINATKISGRSKNGTGLGFFNAISPRDHAVIQNTLTNEERTVIAQPWTNYNVVVWDQNLKNNSYFSVINTNVLREGSARDANVSGIEFEFRNKPNTYGLYGSGSVSHLRETSGPTTGFRYNLGIERVSGHFTWELSHNLENDTYDNNDLGFISSNNERSWYGSTRYSWFNGLGPLLNASIGLNTNYTGLYAYPGEPETQVRDNLFSYAGFEIYASARLRNFYTITSWIYTQPTQGYDYFEPRVPGRFFIYPAFKNIGINIRSDNRRKLIAGINARVNKFHEKQKYQLEYGMFSTFRINNHMSIGYEYNREFLTLDRGFVDLIEDEIIFGARDYTDITQVLRASYTFNPRLALTTRLRHNWTRVQYTHFYTLELDGSITDRIYQEDRDLNFNAWNIDTNLRWRFAPGSDLFIVWKNAIFGLNRESEVSFSENLRHLFDNPQTNSFSVKAIYYIDFEQL